MLEALLSTIGDTIPLKYLLLDGKFGHHNAVQMARHIGLHLVSKLRHDSALYLPYQGENAKCKYGAKVNPRKLLPQFLQFSSTQGDWSLEYYQLQVLHKEFAQHSADDFSILDLKAFYRGLRYLDELIKLLPQKPEPILISRILNRVVNIGAIHPISLRNISIE